MTLHLPNQIEPLTPADAAEIEHNNTHLVDYINTELISRDGAVAMASPLQLSGDPTSDSHAARKGYVDSLLPVGTMMMYGSTVAPTGRWRLCDGSALSTTAFPKLFAVLQYAYGGSGSTFNLPDLRHRVPIGVDSGDARFNAVGKVGGTYEAQLAQHSHTINHDHGAVTSGTQSANHTHSIDHNHGAFNTATAGGHNHDGTYKDVSYAAGGLGTQPFVPSTSPHSGIWPVSAANGGTHAHAIDVPNFDGTSGSNSVSHTHSVNLPSFSGSSGNAGTAGIDQIPEFATVTYIIRTD